MMEAILTKLTEHLKATKETDAVLAFSSFYAKCTDDELNLIDRTKQLFGEDTLALWMEETAIKTGLWKYTDGEDPILVRV